MVGSFLVTEIGVYELDGDGAQEVIVLGTIDNRNLADAVAERVGPGGEELGPHGIALVAAFAIAGHLIAVGDQAEVLVDDYDVPQRVNGALLGAGERGAAVDRAGADDGGRADFILSSLSARLDKFLTEYLRVNESACTGTPQPPTQ